MHFQTLLVHWYSVSPIFQNETSYTLVPGLLNRIWLNSHVASG